MQNSTANIKEIRSTVIAGVTCQFLPLYLVSLISSWLQDTPGYEAIAFLMSALSFIIFCLGYGLCGSAANRYAAYKGYRNPLFIYSVLNIFGLAILFLLDNKKLSSQADRGEPLNKFSIASIFASYLIIPLLITPILLILAFILAGADGYAEYFLNNKNFANFAELTMAVALTCYFIKKFKRAKIDYRHILGSIKQVNFKLPIGLAIIKYLFAWGTNPIILYGLSSIVPKYVESQLNNEYANSLISWLLFLILALIYAPIMEEVFFRGIIFQKLAIKKGFVYGLITSAVLFAAIHFRYDVISLFMTGVITAILYFKTKQLTTSIIYHFTYNFIILVRRIYYQLVSNTESSAQTTIAEFQQQVSDRMELHILLLAISTPYLCYFIYKNYPRHYNVDKLPYFANQETAI